MKAEMFPIADITPLDMAFGAADRIASLMPRMADIPKDFDNQRKWRQLFSDWFYCGLDALDLKPREGVDSSRALRHIRAVMSSFEPKHEHKEAAVAYLLSQWFTDATWTTKAKSR